MLSQLSINNFAIVKFLELDLKQGMTSITGETGAGKSIAIDALGLCLGERAEASNLRAGSDKTEIGATFTIDNMPDVRAWLKAHELDADDECIIRRIVAHDGKSKAYINAKPVPIAILKELGAKLVQIHGQNSHYNIFKPEQQLLLLDKYSDHKLLLEQIKNDYSEYKQFKTTKDQLEQNQQTILARKQLLEYQVSELNEFNLLENEFIEIEAEHKKLSGSATLIEKCQYLLQILRFNEDANCESMLESSISMAHDLLKYDPKLVNINEMLNEALIQIQETSSELDHYLDNIDIDPERLNALNERIDKAITLARKHHIKPQDLFQFHQELIAELKTLQLNQEQLDTIDEQLEISLNKYLKSADTLHSKRVDASIELSKKVTDAIKVLNMPNADFQISVVFDPLKISNNGCDSVEFLINTNLGQTLQPLNKIASGGELSRISLAIQVITAQQVESKTLIFDEVDVGISGATAAIVGKLLRTLGENAQVICVTHLPQVAGNGHYHLRVDKNETNDETETMMVELNTEQRIHELARLLGGDAITNNTLANAKELLIQKHEIEPTFSLS